MDTVCVGCGWILVWQFLWGRKWSIVLPHKNPTQDITPVWHYSSFFIPGVFGMQQAPKKDECPKTWEDWGARNPGFLFEYNLVLAPWPPNWRTGWSSESDGRTWACVWEWLAKKSMILLLNSLSKTLFLDLLGIPSWTKIILGSSTSARV